MYICGKQAPPKSEDYKIPWKEGHLVWLKDLPDKVWAKKPVGDRTSGTQFHTYVKTGEMKWKTMCDGGSGVNSITEEQLVAILNFHHEKGIRLGDKRHPVISLLRN